MKCGGGVVEDKVGRCEERDGSQRRQVYAHTRSFRGRVPSKRFEIADSLRITSLPGACSMLRLPSADVAGTYLNLHPI